ncbi:serine hydrolase [Streptomyces sp. NPDC088258]|uniref:serine hydrolase n=1 Tax=Streptomyces sp. NPDC088258 TaxID=3365849 RepID=UPI00382B091E
MPRHRFDSRAHRSVQHRSVADRSVAHRAVRRRAVPPVLTGLALLLVLALSAWAVTRAGSGQGAGSGANTVARTSRAALASPEPSAFPSVPASVSPSPSPSATSTATEADQVLAGRLASVMKSSADPTASLQVAVLDLAEAGAPARYSAGERETYDTASIVKVDILAALLLMAQDEDRVLTAAERTHATAMIQVSDNASADALWSTIGGTAGLDAANRRLGLTDTTAGSGALWGLTQTTAPDQLTLLAAVFGDGSGAEDAEDAEDADGAEGVSPLSAASRSYARGLMGGIADGQDWGVSAAGTATGLKNGWLSRSATGLWDINSIGRTEIDGHGYLLAVLSQGNASMESGIALVEAAAKAAVAASREA